MAIEYRVEVVEGSPLSVEQLNEYGDLGWELCDVAVVQRAAPVIQAKGPRIQQALIYHFTRPRVQN